MMFVLALRLALGPFLLWVLGSGRVIAGRQILKTSLRFIGAEIFGFLVPASRHRDVGQSLAWDIPESSSSYRRSSIARAPFFKLDRIIGRAKLQGRGRVAGLRCLLQ